MAYRIIIGRLHVCAMHLGKNIAFKYIIILSNFIKSYVRKTILLTITMLDYIENLIFKNLYKSVQLDNYVLTNRQISFQEKKNIFLH